MPTMLRPSRVPVRFAGLDAHRLLNDVVTGRMPREPGVAAWWALLSPQGKIQAEGMAGADAEGALWLDVDASVAEAFFKRMRMYRLRAKADIDVLGESHVVGWSDGPVSDGLAHADQRAGGSGYRVIADRGAASGWEQWEQNYRRWLVSAGIAELGPDFGPDEVFAHDIGMDVLGGIDFLKGCYVGQEVVSRMKHRGTARRRPVLIDGVAAPGGSAVLAGSRDAGFIGTPVDGKAVGIVRLDRFEPGVEAVVDDRPVGIALPDWATYRLGESAAAE